MKASSDTEPRQRAGYTKVVHHNHHRRLQVKKAYYAGDNSSSSGPDERNGGDDGKVSEIRRRRKKRKRALPQMEKSMKRKAHKIEKALQLVVAADDDDDETLHELALSENGLINDDFRRRAWPRLSNLDIVETSVLPTQEEVEGHKWYNQVVLDVDRSLKRFPPGIAEEERPGLQVQLTRLIVRVLCRHPDLHYYQGYHDIAITFLLVVGEQLGFHIMEKLSAKQLKSFMGPTMEETTFLLHFMFPIVRRECEELHDFLNSSEVGTMFALPWLITWFSHVLPGYRDVVRLFDFFLALPSAPMMPVYLAAAVVLHRKDEVLRTACDMASVHELLNRIPADIPIERLLVKARLLHESYPPHALEPEVRERMKMLEEEIRRSADERKAAMAKRLSKGARGSGSYYVYWTVLAAAIPVVLGVLTWKYLHTY